MSVMKLVGGTAADRAALSTPTEGSGSRGPDAAGDPRPRSTSVSVFRFRRDAPPVPATAQHRPEDRNRQNGGAPHDDPRDPLRATLVRTRLDPQRTWDALNQLHPDVRHFDRNRLILQHDGDPAGAAFDLLRTQLVQAAADRGWRRVAVTSPTAGCGKSFVLANLALSLSRLPGYRAVAVDVDLRAPALADLFGVGDAGPLADVLSGEQPVEAMFHRIGQSLALGLNDRREVASAEILQDRRTAEAIDALELALAPDLMLFDLPPLLGHDDVLGFLPRVDGVLLVADGTRTLAADLADAERLLKDRTVLIGVVLNRADDAGGRR